MKINKPFIITSRLLPGLVIGDTELSIGYSGVSGGRTVYVTCIDSESIEYEGRDLESGVGGGSLQEGMKSFLSFLGACGESYSYRMRTGKVGENEDLFPEDVAEWAYMNSDEIIALQCLLEETSKELIEE